MRNQHAVFSPKPLYHYHHICGPIGRIPFGSWMGFGRIFPSPLRRPLIVYQIMPQKVFKVFGVKFSFNPHPFNMKEHTIIVVMANASFAGGVAYATDILLAQEQFYGQFFGWGKRQISSTSTFADIARIPNSPCGYDSNDWVRNGRYRPSFPGLACCNDLAFHLGQLHHVLHAARPQEIRSR
jgi:hypothetical protein